MAQNKGIGIIGLGRVGRCMVGGLLDSSGFNKEQLAFTTKHGETAERASSELGIVSCETNVGLVKRCQTVILATKPQNIGDVLKEIGGELTPTHMLISIVASVPLEKIEKHVAKKVPIARAMPNTPIYVREGITAVCLNEHATEKDWKSVETVFSPLGQLVRVDERYMDAVTGLSASGPAYIYVVLESLTEAGIKVGLPRDLASQLASQTVLGAAKMLQETGRHPAALKDEVTTPAGCTIDGLMELEDGKLRVTLIKAVVQATRRARLLVKKAKL